MVDEVPGGAVRLRYARASGVAQVVACCHAQVAATALVEAQSAQRRWCRAPRARQAAVLEVAAPLRCELPAALAVAQRAW